jgi:P-type Mg2+ transporter
LATITATPKTTPGLTSAEARERLERYGLNEPVAAHRWSALRELLGLFSNPLVVILLLAAFASFLLGDHTDAILIIVIVAISVAINFVQTYRSQVAAGKLRDQVAATATVQRDGTWRDIPRNEVVPGDVVRLAAGDLVPADARLLESKDLYVQQSALTGESGPAEKEAGNLESASESGSAGGADPNSRELVFMGTSVVSGSATALIAATGPATLFGGIAARLMLRAPETAFERDLRHFGGFITKAVLFLVLLLLLVSIAAHRNAFDSLLFAVALAVGLTPEFLPMITSVTLTNGAIRMARSHVIVKQLAAIQNLGSIDILCCDKTGTLTTGVMTICATVDPLGAASEQPLEWACLNSRFETGIRSPLDVAILKRDIGPAGYEKRDEIPFDFERRRLSVVVEKGTDRRIVTKGSPDGVLQVCTTYEHAGGLAPIDEAAHTILRQTYEKLEGEGFRVLAVAHGPAGELTTFSPADEHSLTLSGFLAFSDPPIEDAARTVAGLRRDGVTVKIITGDSGLVARHVCGVIGLSSGHPVLGSEIEEMDDVALGHVAEASSVFARVSPAQKTRILLALRHRGHTVGFMGDGINDAPTLHTADVGISVSGAVDVAREAADIILTVPGLEVLHAGILEGRKAFGNVLKYLFMGTSSNFGNMLSMAVASLFLPFLPMLPTQILLNNLLYDLSQVSIPSDNVDDEYLRRPHRWDFTLIRNFMIYIGPVSSLYDFLTFYVLLRVFHASEAEFHTGWFVESLATQTLVLFVIRTMGNPLKSRPSGLLSATILAVSLAAFVIPYTPLASLLGFTTLPASYIAYVIGATITYLGLVEVAKRLVLRNYVMAAAGPVMAV